MAMLASKSPYGTPVNGGNNQKLPTRTFSETSLRVQQSTSTHQDNLFMSPTNSEFSDHYDGLNSVRAWDEKRVGEWLHSIRCGQYERLFEENNFTGESLLECDQSILTDMGIKKIGDRVRINVAIKQLRNRSLAARNQHRNRESMAALDALTSMAADPSKPQPRLGNKRLESSALKNSSRPSSPLAETHLGGLRSRYAIPSPADSSKREAINNGYFSQPNSASSVNGRRPETPQIVVQSSSNIGKSHLRQNSSIDGLTAGGLPSNSPVIKIVHNGGQTKVVNVKFCKSADEVTMTVLKKLLIPEKHFRNYCCYVLEGLEPKQANCRRITDDELMAICGDASRSERNRLILRKINDGLPDLDEVKKAAKLAVDENQALHANALNATNMRNQIKLQQLTGESWSNIQAPLSPGPMTERHVEILQRADELERAEAVPPRPSREDENSTIRSFFGGRPPSEMIVNELTTYFPGHQKEDIEKTMRMSVRRSQRLSRAASRLSVVSNASLASSLQDAPPVPKIPSIADQWLTKPGEAGIGAKPRPLSVSRLYNPYRDSIASSALAPLQEESPISPTEPNRKSYVSFADSTDSLHLDGQSYFEESPVGTENLNERLSMMVAEDGEEADPELANFLRGNNFDKNNWMKGDLIGEGSFGSVYLALHAITGELMAVKQVELPDVGKGTESDKKKQSMVNALKLEIELLQGLHHVHIVQYLGTSSDETHLNIFLEYVPGGSIAAMLKQYNTFPEPLTRNFTRQILDGLSYLHSRNIIHRDIKGANILVDNRGAVKISDFGVSKQTTSNLTNPSSLSTTVPVGPLGGPGTRTSLQGSVFWMAPEVVRQTGQSIKSDIWSVGCLIVEMFTGSRPFPSMTTLQTLFAVGSQGEKPQIPDVASPDARRFLDLCFEVDQTKRPTATELLKESFCAQSIGMVTH
ncbi:ATP binding [Lithohypha guttulata]|uniref:ATP binding n=1 Tax=Lithohypha guttulata TaxID=1690604 RepID=UPI002DDF4EF0|nr:ATP binding [Lithohypha guttulata]KAK5098682.1 ATP binding [Lithohypha guttulata]